MSIKKINRSGSGLLALLTIGGLARANVTVPSIISDHMVLQAEMETPIWGYADPGEEVRVSFGQQSKTTQADASGKWKVKLDKLPLGASGALNIKGNNTLVIKDVLAGEVWLCSGQSNMVMSLKWANSSKALAMGNHKTPQSDPVAANLGGAIRIFLEQSGSATKPQNLGKGRWVVIEPANVDGHSAVAFYFARELHQKLNRPMGMITSSVGGTPIEAWTDLEMQKSKPELKPVLDSWAAVQSAYNPAAEKALFEKRQAAYPDSVAKAKEQGKPIPPEPRLTPPPCETPSYPGNLFNGKIAPLASYGIRGVLWYQGESNARKNSELYAAQLQLLVSHWRALWGQGDFPFAWVQLPNFNAEKGNFTGWTIVREGMLKSLSVPNTGMVVTIDLGEPEDIHPYRKLEVAQRLSLWALAKVYGKDIPFSSPLPAGQEIKEDKIICTFKYADGGLKTRDGAEVKGFEVAGADRKWFPANSKIIGHRVEVSSQEVKKPVAVRYAWAGNPVCNLVNGSDLPASPFRSEEW